MEIIANFSDRAHLLSFMQIESWQFRTLTRIFSKPYTIGCDLSQWQNITEIVLNTYRLSTNCYGCSTENGPNELQLILNMEPYYGCKSIHFNCFHWKKIFVCNQWSAYLLQFWTNFRLFRTKESKKKNEIQFSSFSIEYVIGLRHSWYHNLSFAAIFSFNLLIWPI